MPSPPTTLVECFWQRVEASGDQLAIFVFPAGKSASFTWQQLAEDTLHAAAKLLSAGLKPGDRVAQVSENRYEWLVSDLAILLLGGVHVPIHASLPSPTIVEQIVDSQARIVLLSGEEQREKLAAEGLRIFAQIAVEFAQLSVQENTSPTLFRAQNEEFVQHP